MSELTQVSKLDAWKQQEQFVQQNRIEGLANGFAYLEDVRRQTEQISVRVLSMSDIALAANIAYGPNISDIAILDFANQAYFADFLHKTDVLGAPEFKTKVSEGIIGLEELGIVKATNGYAEYTHVDYQP